MHSHTLVTSLFFWYKIWQIWDIFCNNISLYFTSFKSFFSQWIIGNLKKMCSVKALDLQRTSKYNVHITTVIITCQSILFLNKHLLSYPDYSVTLWSLSLFLCYHNINRTPKTFFTCLFWFVFLACAILSFLTPGLIKILHTYSHCGVLNCNHIQTSA